VRNCLIILAILAVGLGCDRAEPPAVGEPAVSDPTSAAPPPPPADEPVASPEISVSSDVVASPEQDPASPEYVAVASAVAAAAPRSEIPIRFDIFPRRTQFLLGEPVEIFVQHTNLWDEDVAVRCNYFLDQGFEIWITDSSGESFRFIDEIHGGIPLTNYARIPAGESRGFYELLIHSEVDNRGAVFTEPGLYRIDAQVNAQIDVLGEEILLLLAPPITVEVIEPFTDEDLAVHEIFLWPEVTQALQAMSAPPELEEPMQTVLEHAPDSVFAEHAHFLLSTILMEREEWLPANEHLYEVYSNPDGFYPKDMILINILHCFDEANEPERAVATCRVLLELFPEVRRRNVSLVDSYIELVDEIDAE